ncbi:hypothetical protein LTR66_002055 [Elasticomyces elasticus]|nr:hypothetical protein LTR66_002055 [Elasticomyces elasticus]
MPTSSSFDELPPLTNQDVELLYRIVLHASRSSFPQTRALFAAYDTVLAEYGILPEHDSVYFRFLLRMGQGSATKDNAGLLEKFRDTLGGLGIEIEVRDDGEMEDFATQIVGEETAPLRKLEDFDKAEKAEQEMEAKSVWPGARKVQRRTRRVSFNDTNLDETWLSAERTQKDEAPMQSRASSQDARQTRQADSLITNYAMSNGVRSQSRDPQPYLHARAPVRGRLDGRPLSVARARSTSTQGSVRILRQNGHLRGSSRQPVFQDYRNLASSNSSVSNLSPPRLPSTVVSPVFVPPEHQIYVPTEDDILATAEAVYFTTTTKLARVVLHKWHDRTISSAQRQQDMLTIATNHDRAILLRQALTQLLEALRVKRAAAETTRFFDHLERRASRARDLFLLTKAFTHWASCTSDQVLGTSVARRHILRTRYFNAWRDITAVNDLKVQRFVLRKWLPGWRAKTARSIAANETAVARYEESLMKRIYWNWFWSFCERRAPTLSTARVKRSVFVALASALSSHREKELYAQNIYETKLARNALRRWSSCQVALTFSAATVVSFHHKTLASQQLSMLRIHATLHPLEQQITLFVTTNLLRKAFRVWHLSLQLSVQANEVGRSRVLRDAWTNWNENLRRKALGIKIDERVVLQSLYRWLLASRLKLFRRIADQRLLPRSLQVWSTRVVELRSRLSEGTHRFEESSKRRSLHFGMLRMHASMRKAELQEHKALEFAYPRLYQTALAAWRQKTAHLRKLQLWSQTARFYCLTTHSIKRWQDAMQRSEKEKVDAQKTKRREAYVSIRRRVKVAAERKAFAVWHSRAQVTMSIDQEAGATYERRLLRIGTASFDRWREHTGQVRSLASQATFMDRRRLLASFYTVLMQKHEQLQALEVQALQVVAEDAEAAAVATLKKLKWRLFRVARLEESAEALQERRWETHVRSMVRYWAAQTAGRRDTNARKQAQDQEAEEEVGVGDDSPSRRPSSRRAVMPNAVVDLHAANNGKAPREREIEAFGATSRAETWTPFPTREVDNQPREHLPTPGNLSSTSIPTAIPGYLRTPSKRNARFRRSHLSTIESVGSVASTTPAGLPSVASLGYGTGSRRDATTPAPFVPGGVDGMEALTPQVTPWERKLRAGYGGDSHAVGARTPFVGSRAGTPAFGAARRGVGFGGGLGYGVSSKARFARSGFGAFDGVDEEASGTPMRHEKSS